MGVKLEPVFLRGLDALIGEGEQERVAAHLEVSAATISRIRTCDRGASLAMALRLAEALHVSVEDLVRAPGAAQAAARRSSDRRRVAAHH